MDKMTNTTAPITLEAFEIDVDKLNHLQIASIEKIVRKAKHAHYVDIRIRINGEFVWFEGDWIKHIAARPQGDKS
jgi:hypothetical protein